MTEIGWVILLIIAAALTAIAVAGWLIATTLMRLAEPALCWLTYDKTNPGVLREPEEKKPPDRRPKATAEPYEAPMVRRARMRMQARLEEEMMRSEEHGG